MGDTAASDEEEELPPMASKASDDSDWLSVRSSFCNTLSTLGVGVAADVVA